MGKILVSVKIHISLQLYDNSILCFGFISEKALILSNKQMGMSRIACLSKIERIAFTQELENLNFE